MRRSHKKTLQKNDILFYGGMVALLSIPFLVYFTASSFFGGFVTDEGGAKSSSSQVKEVESVLPETTQ